MTLVEFLQNRPPNSPYAILNRGDELYRAWTSQSGLSDDWKNGPPSIKLSLAGSRTCNLNDPQWHSIKNHTRLLDLINNPNWIPARS